MARSAVILLALSLLAAAAVDGETSECHASEEEDGESLSLRQLRQSKVMGAATDPIINVPGCSCGWIPKDDCLHDDDCAQMCRMRNWEGPCGIAHRPCDRNCLFERISRYCQGPHCTNTEDWKVELCFRDACGVCASGVKSFDDTCEACRKQIKVSCCTKNKGPGGWMSTEHCQDVEFASRPKLLTSTVAPVNVAGCDCSWIPKDDCKNFDTCAMNCRQRNPNGPCGISQHACDCACLTERSCGDPSGEKYKTCKDDTSIECCVRDACGMGEWSDDTLQKSYEDCRQKALSQKCCSPSSPSQTCAFLRAAGKSP